MSALQHRFDLPYTKLLKPLLEGVFEGLALLCENVGTSFESLTDIFVPFGRTYLDGQFRNQDPHLRQRGRSDVSLISDFQKRKQEREKYTDLDFATGISQLIRRAFFASERDDNKAICLPSPLEILLNYLTDPAEPASRAYPFATLRTFLFDKLRVAPDGMGFPGDFDRLTYLDVEDALATVRAHVRGRDNISLTRYRPRTFVLHFLAMKGLLHLRFGSQCDRLKYLEAKALISDINCEFRSKPRIHRFPDAAQLINEIWGTPLPIRGGESIFFGGLKFRSGGLGSVVRVTGAPGSGKTSFALALAAAMAPLGTRTFHVSAEEAPPDLEFRLMTITPTYLRKLRDFPPNQHEWFRALAFPPFDPLDYSDTGVSRLKDLMTEIKAEVGVGRGPCNDEKNERSSAPLPLPCPLMVIVDGIHAYFRLWNGTNTEYGLERFVDDCRKLNALVVITSAADEHPQAEMDYMVDTVIELSYRDTDAPGRKPFRVFELRKTRHQISRPGSHVMHLSGGSGFRIAPQMPSQLDLREVWRTTLPDRLHLIPVLNKQFSRTDVDRMDKSGSVPKDPKLIEKHILDLYVRSHILVHGVGSGGKSGFGLKVLLAPTQDARSERAEWSEAPRVLVVSFLYPEEFYKDLERKLRLILSAEYPDVPTQPASTLEVLHFRPGYLGPEDLFSKLARRLDAAELEGRPCTGVLLDGLHNVFLQFPRLEDTSMLWPMLYSHLRTRDLTVVTTHTTFSVPGSWQEEGTEYALLKAKPLLHAIVQAADFFLDISEKRGNIDEKECIEYPTVYQLNVNSTVGQRRTTEAAFWHREHLVLYAESDQLPLNLMGGGPKRSSRPRGRSSH